MSTDPRQLPLFGYGPAERAFYGRLAAEGVPGWPAREAWVNRPPRRRTLRPTPAVDLAVQEAEWERERRAAPSPPPPEPERRRGGRPLVISKPPKRPNEMTRAEIEVWARQIFDGMKSEAERAGLMPSPEQQMSLDLDALTDASPTPR